MTVFYFLVACGFVADSYVHVDNCATSNKHTIVMCCEATDKQRVQDASFAQINSKKQRFTSKRTLPHEQTYKKQKYMRAKRTRHRKKKLDTQQALQFGHDARKSASEIRTRQWTEEKNTRIIHLFNHLHFFDPQHSFRISCGGLLLVVVVLPVDQVCDQIVQAVRYSNPRVRIVVVHRCNSDFHSIFTL